MTTLNPAPSCASRASSLSRPSFCLVALFLDGLAVTASKRGAEGQPRTVCFYGVLPVGRALEEHEAEGGGEERTRPTQGWESFRGRSVFGSRCANLRAKRMVIAKLPQATTRTAPITAHPSTG